MGTKKENTLLHLLLLMWMRSPLHTSIRPTSQPSFPSDHIPVCFPFPPGPSSGGHENVRFAFVVGLEAHNSTARRKSPCSPTVGTFHKRNATLLKTLAINGNHPQKRAFGRGGGRVRDLLPRSRLIRLFCWRDRRWPDRNSAPALPASCLLPLPLFSHQ